MSRYGYERCAANQAQIVAYGDADEISHFARRNVDNTTVAKWGEYEVIYTAGINVYASLSAGGYGEPRLYYKKTH